MNMHASMDGLVDHAARLLWDRTLAERETAKQALDHHNTTIYQPLHDEVERLAPRPDLHFEIEARNGQVARFHVDPRDLNAWDQHLSPVFRHKAAAIREAWLAHRGTSERLGADAAGEESDRLCDAQCELEGTLIQMPAPDRSALLWKLEHLFGPETRGDDQYSDGWCAAWMNVVMDDARRFLGSNVGSALALPVDARMAA